MKTDQLIAGLARDLKPAAPLPSPAIRLGQWLAVLPLLVTPGLLVWGLRDDLAAVLEDRVELTWAAFAFATACIAAWSALRLAVPGARGVAMTIASSLAAVVLWSASLVNDATSGAGFAVGAMAWPYPICIVKVATIALMPAAALFVMIRQAAPIRTHLMSGMAALAATAIGALGTQLACPNEMAAHVLLGHVAPMAAISLASAAAPRLARRTRGT